MNLSEIAHYRLVSQQIATTKLTTAVEMVAWLGGVQAQEYTQTKWGIGVRLPHLKDIDIESNLTEGKILRTHLLRPTWHFVTAEDIRWMLKLTAPRVQSANAFMYRKLELQSKLFTRCNDLLIKLLEGNKQLTRTAINEEFKKQNILANGLRLSYIMMQAELDSIICSGAKQGNQFTYALLDERVPSFRAKHHDEALAELATRYFGSRGPATIKDFSTWSGLTMTDCRRGISMLSAALEKVRADNREFYCSSAVLSCNEQFQGIGLLPVYDEFIMSYKDRIALFIWRDAINPKPAFKNDSTIVFQVQIIGTWKRTINKNSIDLHVDFFSPMQQGKNNALKKAIERFEEFYALPVMCLPEMV